MGRLLNEPAVIAEAIRMVILAAVAFGLNWTGDQVAALMLAVSAVLTVLTRAVVVPSQLVQERIDEGRHPVSGKMNPSGPSGPETGA